MAPADIDHSPFGRMLDLETVPDCPDSGDMNAAAHDSFLNQVTAAAWTTSDEYTGKPGGISGVKNEEGNANNPESPRAARKQLLAALMQALADSADNTAAAADEPSSPEFSALAAGTRKRKASEIEEAPSAAAAPAEGGSEAEVTRELRRAICAVILRSEPSRPAPCAGFPGAPAPPAPASTTKQVNTVGRTLAHGPLQMPFRLPIAKGAAPAAPSAAPPLLATVPEAAACMNYFDNSDDDMAGFGGSPACGGANGAADDDWLPRNRGRKDRHAAGERIKARSMAERQRRERISEGLQKLRLVVRGHGDTATMLDKAVAYVDALQRRVTALETALLLHQASCKHPRVQPDWSLASSGESSELL
ncbi:unnamed protein product [Closterium sp. Yama58-4]|nr:unnamed protein product [Closterium sp. Yama58-4]